jgi:hypothetical protein
MVVIGGVGLMLLNITVPVFIKFPILVILSYLFLNMIVYVYRKVVLKKRI